MPEVAFAITGVTPVTRGLTPLLHFKLQITPAPDAEAIQALTLRAQVQVQAPRRAYSASEKEQLVDLFGPPENWGQTLRNRLWAHAHTTVGAFAGRAEADLPVPCTYDLNVAMSKYFYALEGGDVPLLFLFSGTLFYATADGRLQAQPVPWNSECSYSMPAKLWHDLTEQHYPNSAWLYLRRDAFDRLYAYKRRHGVATWEQVLERLLPEPEEAPA